MRVDRVVLRRDERRPRALRGRGRRPEQRDREHEHPPEELAEAALRQALQGWRPGSPGSVALLHHSDRGVQYASTPYRGVLERHGIRQSMSRRGDCLDNAPMESFFASLKTERVHQGRFRTREAAKAAVFDYVEIFYNRQRSG